MSRWEHQPPNYNRPERSRYPGSSDSRLSAHIFGDSPRGHNVQEPPHELEHVRLNYFPRRLLVQAREETESYLQGSTAEEFLAESEQTLVSLQAQFDVQADTLARLLNHGRFQPAHVEHFTTVPAEDLAHDQECPICQFSYNDGAHVAIKLRNVSCDHVFGKECLQTWVISGAHMAHNCPTCRQSISGALSTPSRTSDGLARRMHVQRPVIASRQPAPTPSFSRPVRSLALSNARDHLDDLLAQLDSRDLPTSSYGRSASLNTQTPYRPDTPEPGRELAASATATYGQYDTPIPHLPHRAGTPPQMPHRARNSAPSSRPVTSHANPSSRSSSPTISDSDQSGPELSTLHLREIFAFEDSAAGRLARAMTVGGRERTMVESAVMMERAAMAARHTREENAALGMGRG